jgi:hypothetical protein
MTDKFGHIIVLNQIKFHPLMNVKHNILYTIEISLPWQAILNIIFLLLYYRQIHGLIFLCLQRFGGPLQSPISMNPLSVQEVCMLS